jgi:hypothetical protein
MLRPDIFNSLWLYSNNLLLYKYGVLENALHLAGTLKKLLTILLLFVMIVKVSVCFYSETHEVTFLQEADEKGEKSGEDKKEKEYVLNATLKKPEPSEKAIFGFHSCDPGIFPILDHVTPPPDFN